MLNAFSTASIGRMSPALSLKSILVSYSIWGKSAAGNERVIFSLSKLEAICAPAGFQCVSVS